MIVKMSANLELMYWWPGPKEFSPHSNNIRSHEARLKEKIKWSTHILHMRSLRICSSLWFHVL
jgi:hypothetical protein